MSSPRVRPPFQIVLIAGFQFLKAGFLLVVAGYLLLAPDSLPHSTEFSQFLAIAAHGKDLSGILVPAFGFYLLYIGIALLLLRKRTRRNLAISSVITICCSLDRLGIFGDTNLTSQFDRETLYIIILLDLAVYLYLAFHPHITRTFNGRPVNPASVRLAPSTESSSHQTYS
jgi:hypothetical protein